MQEATEPSRTSQVFRQAPEEEDESAYHIGKTLHVLQVRIHQFTDQSDSSENIHCAQSIAILPTPLGVEARFRVNKSSHGSEACVLQQWQQEMRIQISE